MKRSRLPILLSAMLCWCAGPDTARGDDDWRPIPLKVNDVAGRYNWSVNGDISFHCARITLRLYLMGGSRVQKHWRILTDQKWDWLRIVEYAHRGY